MSNKKKDSSKINKKLKHSYRIIIRNDEDLKEINSFVLSRYKIYFLLFTLLLLIGGIIISLIAFTPLKMFVPGYGDIHNNTVFVKLNNEINELEKQIEEQLTYTESLKKIIFKNDQPNIFLEEQNDHKVPVVNSKSTSEYNSNIIPFLFPPVKGATSKGYQLKDKHFGIDLVCTKNSEVKSIAKGVILNIVWDPMTGNTLSIQHPNNLVSIYKHNASILKEIGDQVAAGEAIAIVGNTGEQSSGPHLHFELWSNGQAVNPALFIEF